MKNEIKRLIKESSKSNIVFDAQKLNSIDNILYGTFGFHDEEPPLSIVSRKLKEIEETSFSLWGLSRSINIDNFVQKCKVISNAQNGEVYIVLKITKSDDEKGSGSLEDSWDWDRLLQSEHFNCCMMNGEKLDLISKHIMVKGRPTQNKALVVEEYYFYEDKLTAELVNNCYEKPNKLNIHRANGDHLIRKKDLREEVEKLTKKTKDDWAIILKLKDPYIVECLDYQEASLQNK